MGYGGKGAGGAPFFSPSGRGPGSGRGRPGMTDVFSSAGRHGCHAGFGDAVRDKVQSFAGERMVMLKVAGDKVVHQRPTPVASPTDVRD